MQTKWKNDCIENGWCMATNMAEGWLNKKTWAKTVFMSGLSSSGPINMDKSMQ